VRSAGWSQSRSNSRSASVNTNSSTSSSAKSACSEYVPEAMTRRTTGNTRAEDQTSTYRLVGLFEPSRAEEFRKLLAEELPELKVDRIDFEKAEVTLRYELASLFSDGKVPKGFTAEKLREKIDQTIRGKSKGTFQITWPSSVAPGQQTRVDIKVGVLDCRGCRFGVYQIVAKIDGVERASVTSDTHVLTAWIDPAKTNREALEAALKKSQVQLVAQ